MSKHHTRIANWMLAGLALATLAACSRAPEPAPVASAPARADAPPANSTASKEPEHDHLVAPPLASARKGGELPPNHPPIDPGREMPAASGGSEMAWTTPAGWVREKPASAMRMAQYRVPGPAGDGELVVFYFGPGQGGDPMANAQRWAGQFKTADGQPALPAMKTATVHVGDIEVMTVELAGTYDGGMTMTEEPATPKPGYMLLGAIAEGPDAYWFFKFTGPEATVRAQRGSFDALVSSFKHAN